MIKKALLAVFITTSLLMPAAAAVPAYAVDILNPGGSAGGVCNNTNAASKPSVCSDNHTSGSNPILGKDGLLTSAINILSLVVGVVSVVIIVTEGIRMIVSAGDANTAGTARRGLVYACVGLITALLAQAIVALVLSKLK